MTNTTTEGIIQEQRDKFLSPAPLVNLVSPCRLQNGILSFSDEEKLRFQKIFKRLNSPIGFFIPASGSGSRMFQFLYEFIADPKETVQPLVERFVNSIDQFAFYQKLPDLLRLSIQKGDFILEDLLLSVIGKNGLNLGLLPKGLIPFHKFDPFILSPFQEQLLQGSKLKHPAINFHFTVQKEYQTTFLSHLKTLEETTGRNYKATFSIQHPDTDAISFREDGTVFTDTTGEIVTRPAGHGSLLKNLSETEGEIIFIKNIDNVQHYAKSENTIDTWQLLGGVITEFRREAALVYENPAFSAWDALNKKYQLFPESEIMHISNHETIRTALDRPVRVCGMVRNQGQTGGGPFWVKENGRITKQIVEKAQIASSPDQLDLMVKSTHFNPVMIAACPFAFDGTKYDLQEYIDHSKYFKVSKTHLGEKIGYIELPGLWNGSMAHWNTIFVEIPSEVFSPVKTVLDLLEEPHRC